MKDTLKTLELLEEHIDRLAEQGIYEIERDLLLESLRRMYTSVLSIDTVAEEEKVIDALLGLPKEFFEPSDEEMYGCPPADFKEIIPEEEVAEEPEEEAEPVTEEVIAELEEEVIEETEEEEPATEPEPIAEETEVGDEIDHEVLISLYDDEEDEEPAVEEESEEETEVEVAPEEPKAVEEEPADIEEEPIIEEIDEEEDEEPTGIAEGEPTAEKEETQSVVLGDVLAMEQTTLADNLAEQMGTDVATAVGANLSLRQTIAINDKFILMRDLFGGNNDYYETAIEKLDSFDNLDDAMLYIYDHFHWNPNSEGARLLMELLARKLF
ncbi:MAG: hypothetical protein IJZ09_07255 [Tidjanibacter sp.]|nr:hypothetical protein [Tidjanibacter sp.]